MKFDQVLKNYFNAVDGAFSVISTADEATKSQITLTDFERELAIEHFGKEYIHKGAVKINPNLSAKPFIFYNTGSEIILNLNFPKEGKDELRLYMSSRQGFKAPAGSVWFIYKRIGDELLTIGYMDRKDWLNNCGRKELNEIDKYDEEYQENIVSELAHLPSYTFQLQYHRSAKVGAISVVEADFKCQIDEKHVTFISRVSQKPYLEIHHLIPVSKQKDFIHSLDIKENIIVLCPACHRKFHHAEVHIQKELIKHFYEERAHHLAEKSINIDINQLEMYYGIV